MPQKMTSLDALKVVDTAEAARVLGLRPQTMRKWACTGRGAIKPATKIGNRLGWRVADLERVLQGKAL